MADTPGVLVRPPRLYLGMLIAGILVGWLLPAQMLPVLPLAVLALLGPTALALGVALMIWAMRHFRRAGTPVPTSQTVRAIVTDGPYRYSRNPIYVTLSLIYAGIALMAGSVPALLLLPVIWVVMTYGVIRREERYLATKFGVAYADYMARVRRWL